MQPSTDTGLRIFISYSHKDEAYRQNLEEHLASLHRRARITSWTDRKIVPGQHWENQINSNIELADIIILLVSPSFTASDYCMAKELAIALDRHEKESAVVIPVFVRPTDLNGMPFMSIQGLPKDALPISQWPDQDLAWLDVAKGIGIVAGHLQEQKRRSLDSGNISSVNQTIRELVDRIDKQYKNVQSIRGFETGLKDVDAAIDGLHEGQLFTLASRPSMGKTNFALNIAAYVGRQMPVLIFSTRLSKREITERLLSIIGLIHFQSVQQAQMTDSDWPQLAHGIQVLSESPIAINDTTQLSIDSVRADCLAAQRTYGALSLVIIDSVQYFDMETAASSNHDYIAKSLKRLAREFNCCVLVTAPISRTLETRPNKRPVMTDLEDWAVLEDESDVVAFLYIDSHYNFESMQRGLAELIFSRNAYGGIGTVTLLHMPTFGKFADLETIPPK